MADYTTLLLVKAQLGITDHDKDYLIVAAISAVSRAIDLRTDTTFYPVTEARLFMAPRNGEALKVDRFTDPTGLVVATGTGGTYTTIVAAGQFTLLPLNAPSRGLAYDRIVFAAAPPAGSWAYPTVQVTASWGYATVPAQVEEAARIMAATLFRRKDSPEGEAGAMEAGTAIGRDDHVDLLLEPYTEYCIA